MNARRAIGVGDGVRADAVHDRPRLFVLADFEGLAELAAQLKVSRSSGGSPTARQKAVSVKKKLVVEVMPQAMLERLTRLSPPRPHGTPAVLAAKLEDRIRRQSGIPSISSMPSLRDRASTIEIDPVTGKPYAR